MAGSEPARRWEGGLALIARVGDRRIAIPAAQVSALSAIADLWRPPTLPPAVAGFARIGPRALPVLHVACLLALDAQERPDFYAHILILPTLGLLVERAEEIVDIPPAGLLPIDPRDSYNGCAVAIAETATGHAHVILPERLLAANEAQTLAALTAEATRRMDEWGSAG